jgi:hypothetical protein
VTGDRRRAVGFDPDYFARQAAQGRPLSPAQTFRHAFETNLWGGAESPSGPGSSLEQTTTLGGLLPDLCRRRGVHRLLDLPCGDGHWMATIPLPGVRYYGADLVPEIVARAAADNPHPDRRFGRLDLTTDPLPSADLLLCRDCLVHLSFADARRALANVRRSDITYLLTTTFPAEPHNVDVVTGDWRPLNLLRPPFGFPEPLELLVEGCTEHRGLFRDKSLGLWRVADLPAGNEQAA